MLNLLPRLIRRFRKALYFRHFHRHLLLLERQAQRPQQRWRQRKRLKPLKVQASTAAAVDLARGSGSGGSSTGGSGSGEAAQAEAAARKQHRRKRQRGSSTGGSGSGEAAAAEAAAAERQRQRRKRRKRRKRQAASSTGGGGEGGSSEGGSGKSGSGKGSCRGLRELVQRTMKLEESQQQIINILAGIQARLDQRAGQSASLLFEPLSSLEELIIYVYARRGDWATAVTDMVNVILTPRLQALVNFNGQGMRNRVCQSGAATELSDRELAFQSKFLGYIQDAVSAIYGTRAEDGRPSQDLVASQVRQYLRHGADRISGRSHRRNTIGAMTPSNSISARSAASTPQASGLSQATTSATPQRAQKRPAPTQQQRAAKRRSANVNRAVREMDDLMGSSDDEFRCPSDYSSAQRRRPGRRGGGHVAPWGGRRPKKAEARADIGADGKVPLGTTNPGWQAIKPLLIRYKRVDFKLERSFPRQAGSSAHSLQEAEQPISDCFISMALVEMTPSTMSWSNATTTETRYWAWDPEFEALIHPFWRQFPPVPELHHYLVGIYISVVGIIGDVGNLLVLFIFVTTKALRTPPNIFLVNLAISDLSFSVIMGFPLLTISSFNGRWAWGRLACELYGFFGGVLGFVSIHTLALISMDRYFVIAQPFEALKRLTYTRAIVMVFFAWSLALLWAIPPFFGY
uniref:G_PROTEIN_RECEP_F1_2 domain-containing protein n=1 Tax=Macrostomum lignano TaxID=282301 RepID=A0A1I8IGJ3_9PLAT